MGRGPPPKIRAFRRIDLGFAVQAEDGLLVPVIRAADTKSLTQLAREAKDLSDKVKSGKRSPDELAGGTFTVATRVRTAVGAPAVEDVALRAPEGWMVKALPPASPAPPAGTLAVRHEVTVAADARPTQPHWHIEPGAGRNRMDDVADPLPEGLAVREVEAKEEAANGSDSDADGAEGAEPAPDGGEQPSGDAEAGADATGEQTPQNPPSD